MTGKQTDFVLYLVKCIIGVVVGFCLYQLYPEIGAWCLVSIVLVLSPDREDAIKLAFSRIKANLVGATVGLGLFFVHPTNLLMLCLGVLAVVIICQLLNLADVARSAAVSVVIILLHKKGEYFWDVAVQRAGGVVVGCVIAILITLGFHLVVILEKRKSNHLLKQYR